MGNSFRCLVLMSVFLLPSASVAESISGNQFLNLSEKQKGWYFLGVLDAMKQTRDTYFKASDMTESDFDHIWESCISGRPVRQHLAIVESWLKENPTPERGSGRRVTTAELAQGGRGVTIKDTFASLAYRNFVWLWLGQITHAFALWVDQIAKSCSSWPSQDLLSTWG